MTIPDVRHAIEACGLRIGHQNFDHRTGECVMEVMDADGHNSVRLRFPYTALTEPKLPEHLIDLYFGELKIRQAKKAMIAAKPKKCIPKKKARKPIRKKKLINPFR